MDSREISKITTKYDGVICGFCLPYLSQTDAKNLILDAKNLLNEQGIIYISFIDGDPSKSGFQTSSTGDRSYFYYHTLAQLKAHLIGNSFKDLRTFKVEYKKSETEVEIHTIVTSNKK